MDEVVEKQPQPDAAQLLGYCRWFYCVHSWLNRLGCNVPSATIYCCCRYLYQFS
jgi:hypothetical protein